MNRLSPPARRLPSTAATPVPKRCLYSSPTGQGTIPVIPLPERQDTTHLLDSRGHGNCGRDNCESPVDALLRINCTVQSVRGVARIVRMKHTLYATVL